MDIDWRASDIRLIPTPGNKSNKLSRDWQGHLLRNTQFESDQKWISFSFFPHRTSVNARINFVTTLSFQTCKYKRLNQDYIDFDSLFSEEKEKKKK